MIIKKLCLRNYGSFRQTEISIMQGVIGIIGQSSQNEKKSNGSGKSTCLEAINFALFGKSSRESLTFPDLYNEKEDGEPLEVEMTFSVWGREFYISRSWTEKDGTYLRYAEEGHFFEGSVREVQNKISDLISVPFSVFTATSFFLQGKSDMFCAALPSERLQYLREVLPLSFWDKCYDTVTPLLNVSISKLSSDKSTRDALSAVIAKYRLEISEENREYLSGLKLQCEGGVENLQKEVDSLKSVVDGFAADMQRLDFLHSKILQLSSSEGKWIDKLEKLKVEREKLSKQSYLVKVFKSVSFLSKTNLHVITILSEKRGNLNSTLSHLIRDKGSLRVGKCENCFSTVTPERVQELRIIIDKESFLIQNQIQDVNDELKKHQELKEKLDICDRQNKEIPLIFSNCERLLSISSEIESLEEMIREISFEEADLRYEEDILKQKNSQIDVINPIYLNKKIEFSSAKVELENVIKKMASFQKTEEMMVDTSNQVSVLNEEIKKGEKESTVLGRLKVVFGKGGISYYIIKKVVESELQQSCNDILSKLSNFRIEFSLKSSTDKNTLNILVHSGIKIRKYETYSGGERELINFSIRMALSRLLRKRCESTPIQFVVLDEIFGFLDEYNRTSLENALMMLRAEFPQIFVTSHVSLNIPFDQVIKINKLNGESSLDIGGENDS